MSSKTRRWLTILLIPILILCFGATAIGLTLPRRSFPIIKGEIRLADLNAPVDIYRDAYGIPHIYAETSHDLFFAQGFLHAQDRFWQMDFWRHIGSGNLSGMFGTSELENDRFLRTLGWARIANQEFAALSTEDQRLLQAYADGVNAYLQDRNGSQLSLEYAVLGMINPDYQPEPWQPVHSLTWAKVMAWDLGRSRMGSEIQRAILLKDLTPTQLDELIPPYPEDHPLVVPDFEIPDTNTNLNNSDPTEVNLQFLRNLAPVFESLAQQQDRLLDPLGSSGLGLGSNNWVIAGSRTASGMPLLADDMHLGVQMPAIWYEVGLYCVPKGVDCPYQVTGFSFAGVPGVIVGHNDRIAWGMTNLGPDVIDLYIEKINPSNPHQYEYNGEWVDMQVIQETLQASDGDPEILTVRYTRHGPIISDTFGGLEGFTEQAGIELPPNYAIAMRWTALEPNRMVSAILGFNRARNLGEFREAASSFAVPAQNLVYADVDGNIAYQTPGWIPIRAAGHDGKLPVPGWTDAYEWQGYIPFEQLPHTANPPQGYIVTANNAVVGTEYPYPLTFEWDYGFRARRIVEMIEQASNPITVEYVQLIHGDNLNLNAQVLIPPLLQIPLQEERLIEARSFLQNWDYQDQMDLAAPAVYNAFWKHLLARTFRDDLPERYWPDGGSRWFEITRQLIQQPASPWWDDRLTTAIEGRDEIFRQAFSAAVTELEKLLGKDKSRWTWGDLHSVTFRNLSLGESGIAPIEALFNRGPFRTSGGSSLVNATGWNAAQSDLAQSYQLESLPSQRMIVDLSNLDGSLGVITTGQSGHAYHAHYIDMADLWRNIQYHPMLWERTRIESESEGYLRLIP
jgi:penicillin amidase